MKYFNLLFVALVVIFATACKENNLNTPDLNSQEEKISLPMTKWTLQGIFDTKTQKLQQLAQSMNAPILLTSGMIHQH